MRPGSYTIKVVDANNCTYETTRNISDAPSELKGFVGVAELIGCGKTGPTAGKAKIKFTNVSGGQPPYSYKYDGNYTSSSEGWLPTGRHTVYIKDARGCELPLQVTVDPVIPEPAGFTYTATDFDCNGKATVQFRTSSPTSYDYEYEVNGKKAKGRIANIAGLAPGTYTVTVR